LEREIRHGGEIMIRNDLRSLAESYVQPACEEWFFFCRDTAKEGE